MKNSADIKATPKGIITVSLVISRESTNPKNINTMPPVAIKTLKSKASFIGYAKLNIGDNNGIINPISKDNPNTWHLQECRNSDLR